MTDWIVISIYEWSKSKWNKMEKKRKEPNAYILIMKQFMMMKYSKCWIWFAVQINMCFCVLYFVFSTGTGPRSLALSLLTFCQHILEEDIFFFFFCFAYIFILFYTIAEARHYTGCGNIYSYVDFQKNKNKRNKKYMKTKTERQEYSM